MSNVFNRDASHSFFKWSKLGDIKAGRAELGEDMPVVVYRLLEYSMLNVLVDEYGKDRADELFRKAGFLAGFEFAANVLDLSLDIDGFFAALQKVLKDLRIGILRIEHFDEETGDLILTVSEDLDCSGLPVTNEVVCNYDEGLLSGILKAYTRKDYKVREIDCWASGDRVCRFRGTVMSPETAE
ncbi:MAG: 4-vinyl reductase [Synergistaceae bacterium]|nr:4-vinyl reductase [Synergistaceae bacterium]